MPLPGSTDSHTRWQTVLAGLGVAVASIGIVVAVQQKDSASESTQSVVAASTANGPVLAVRQLVRIPGTGRDGWLPSVTASPGDRVEVLTRVANDNDRSVRDILVGANLPRYSALEAGSAVISRDGTTRSATLQSLERGGFNVGSLKPGQSVSVRGVLRLDSNRAYPNLGRYTLAVVGAARPVGHNMVYNTAEIRVDVQS